MIGYVSVGSNDIARSRRFYSAVLLPMGYSLHEGREGLSFALPVPDGQVPLFPDFYVKPPFDGKPALAGNGTMVAFEARDQAQVRALHAAALRAGGRDEGAPGFRSDYSAEFFVSYLRDPDGNKVAIYSTNPADPRRDG